MDGDIINDMSEKTIESVFKEKILSNFNGFISNSFFNDGIDVSNGYRKIFKG